MFAFRMNLQSNNLLFFRHGESDGTGRAAGFPMLATMPTPGRHVDEDADGTGFCASFVKCLDVTFLHYSGICTYDARSGRLMGF